MFLIAATLIIDTIVFRMERMAVSKSVTKVELLSCSSERASVYYLYTGRDNSICYSSNCYIRLLYRDEIRVVM